MIREVAEVWKDALVVKLLGKSIGYATLLNKLKALWRLKAGSDIMNVGNDHYMVKFDLSEDRSLVVERGPWMINGHYLVIKQWSAQFNPADPYFGHIIVWIRLSTLNFLYYDERMLRAITSAISKPIR